MLPLDDLPAVQDICLDFHRRQSVIVVIFSCLVVFFVPPTIPEVILVGLGIDYFRFSYIAY